MAQALAWIGRQRGPVTARLVLRHHVAGVKTATEARQLLQRLEDRGYGTVEEGPKRQVTFRLHL